MSTPAEKRKNGEGFLGMKWKQVTGKFSYGQGTCHPLSVFFLFSLGVVLFRTAWLSDDSYITFRTVDNFIKGYGLTWNVDERVQVYTHPLWMLLVSLLYFFTHEIYYTSIILSIALSLAAVAICAFFMASSRTTATLGVAIAIFSKAFVDYATSGLENPLTYLLLSLFLLYYLRTDEESPKALFTLALVAALATLNRMDTLLFFLPVLTYRVWKISLPKGAVALVLGFLPFILWECFSLFYYGFLFPNTAYAKLGTGIAAGDLVMQGLYYLLDSLVRDPLTLLTIAAGIGVSFFVKPRRLVAVAIGVILYMLYVIEIGGDFMSGRFLAVPLFCSVMLLVQVPLRAKPGVAAFAIIFGISLLSPRPSWPSGADYGSDYTQMEKQADISTGAGTPHGIVDERRFYYPHSGLLNALKPMQHSIWPDHEWSLSGSVLKARGRGIVVSRGIGYLGFFCGTNIHVVDELALADPLLARLPSAGTSNWRIGHFERMVPDGYIETLATGRNMICDRNLASFYDKLALVTRGDLFSGRRLSEIIKMNLGKYDNLINYDFYRNMGAIYDYMGEDSTIYDRIASLENAVKSGPGSAYLHYDLGILYSCAGRTDEAARHLEIAAQLKPRDYFISSDLSRVREKMKSVH